MTLMISDAHVPGLIRAQQILAHLADYYEQDAMVESKHEDHSGAKMSRERADALRFALSELEAEIDRQGKLEALRLQRVDHITDSDIPW